AATHEAHWHVEGQAQFAVPLVQQVDRRRDDQGGTIQLLDGEDGQERLARACGQDDDATPPGAPPGFKALLLMRERIAGGAQAPGGWFPRAGVVGVGDLLLAEELDEGTVVSALGAMVAGPRVVADARERREELGVGPRDDDGAALVPELDCGSAH